MNKEILELQEKLKAQELRKEEEAQILELGNIANEPKKALDAIASGMSYKDFSFSLLQNNNSLNQSPRKQETKNDICFSLANYALSVANGRQVGEIEFKEGNNGGFIIPNEYYGRFSNEQVDGIDEGKYMYKYYQ